MRRPSALGLSWRCRTRRVIGGLDFPRQDRENEQTVFLWSNPCTMFLLTIDKTIYLTMLVFLYFGELTTQ